MPPERGDVQGIPGRQHALVHLPDHVRDARVPLPLSRPRRLVLPEPEPGGKVHGGAVGVGAAPRVAVQRPRVLRRDEEHSLPARQLREQAVAQVEVQRGDAPGAGHPHGRGALGEGRGRRVGARGVLLPRRRRRTRVAAAAAAAAAEHASRVCEVDVPTERLRERRAEVAPPATLPRRVRRHVRPRLAQGHVVRPVAQFAAAEEGGVVLGEQEGGPDSRRAVARLERAEGAPATQRAAAHPLPSHRARQEGPDGAKVAGEPRGERVGRLGARVRDRVVGGGRGRLRALVPGDRPAVGTVPALRVPALQPSHG